MNSAEHLLSVENFLPKWIEALGVKLPPAPVVIRDCSSAFRSSENPWEQIKNPGRVNVSWMTTEIALPHGFEDFTGAVVIDRKGDRANVGVAVPYNSEAHSPLWFLWESWEAQLIIETIEDDIKVERLGDFGDAFVYRMSHPFFSQEIPEEGYLVFQIQSDSPTEALSKLVEPRKLISGSAHGKLKDRLSTAIYQDLPFEYLLGLSKPGSHQLGKVGKRILGLD